MYCCVTEAVHSNLNPNRYACYGFEPPPQAIQSACPNRKAILLGIVAQKLLATCRALRVHCATHRSHRPTERQDTEATMQGLNRTDKAPPFRAGPLQLYHQLQRRRLRFRIKLPWRLQHQKCHLRHLQSNQRFLRHLSHADTMLQSTRIALRADITRLDVPIDRTPPHPGVRKRNNAEPI